MLTRPAITVVQQQTLDQLWHEAESLGRVSVEDDWHGVYKAQIRFKRKSGTTIWAEGKHTSALIALSMAINEAREMGAGTDA